MSLLAKQVFHLCMHAKKLMYSKTKFANKCLGPVEHVLKTTQVESTFIPSSALEAHSPRSLPSLSDYMLASKYMYESSKASMDI